MFQTYLLVTNVTIIVLVCFLPKTIIVETIFSQYANFYESLCILLQGLLPGQLS